MKTTRCPTCKRPHKRSTQANARLWLLYHLIAERVRPDGKAFSADQWHCYFKSRFLGCDEMTIPNGKTLLILKSTTSLDTAEFNEYMTNVESWASERDVWLADMESAA